MLTDPPYGVNEKTNRATAGRGSDRHNSTSALKNAALCVSYDFPPVFGDDEPFDPSPLLAYERLILFGGNYFAHLLPPSPSWIVWDKLAGLTTEKRLVGVDDNADLELAWTNLGGPARLIPHRWKGTLKGSERDQRRVHPTQKPVALMEAILAWRSEPDDLIFDPYMGSGPVAAAAKNLGRRYIGIEYSAEYCERAVDRLAQGVLESGRSVMIEPYYADELITLYNGDTLDILPELDGDLAHLIATDPPYFRVASSSSPTSGPSRPSPQRSASPATPPRSPSPSCTTSSAP